MKQCKRLVSALLCVLLIAAMAAVSAPVAFAAEYNPSYGVVFTDSTTGFSYASLTASPEECIIIAYDGREKDVVIPSTMPYSPQPLVVTGLKSMLFQNMDITSVSLPETLTDIGQNAFSGCTQLQEVTIPDSVEFLGFGAFLNEREGGMQNFKDQFYLNFIKDDRWQYLTDGLKTTLLITFFAVILGLVLGFLAAIVRSTAVRGGVRKPPRMKEKGLWLWKAAGYYLFRLVDLICQIYLTVIRGTPTMIQLLIMYYVIFGSVNIDKRIVAILAFGINSGAYVAEIVRSGIMAIDIGQFEAGRSLGFSYPATMWHIVLPQAFKNVLPALGNEIIVLLKETSISGYIALTDLTHGGNVIRSHT